MMNISETKRVNTNDIFKTANIILAGITGAGKSTLINAVFGKDFAAKNKHLKIKQIIFTLFGTALIREETDTSLQKRNLLKNCIQSESPLSLLLHSVLKKTMIS